MMKLMTNTQASAVLNALEQEMEDQGYGEALTFFRMECRETFHRFLTTGKKSIGQAIPILMEIKPEVIAKPKHYVVYNLKGRRVRPLSKTFMAHWANVRSVLSTLDLKDYGLARR